MTLLFIGIIAFICFFLYDINSVIWQKKIFRHNFIIGIVLIAFSTASIVIKSIEHIQLSPARTLLGAVTAVFFFGGLIYTLFFALPFKTTYIETTKRKTVYDHGIYALCRHPGFWFLVGLYVSLYIIVPSKQIFIMTLAFNGLNFLYVVFQDRWTFPQTFIDYERYVKSTPFLVPNFESIKKCTHTIKK